MTYSGPAIMPQVSSVFVSLASSVEVKFVIFAPIYSRFERVSQRLTLFGILRSINTSNKRRQNRHQFFVISFWFSHLLNFCRRASRCLRHRGGFRLSAAPQTLLRAG